MFIVIARIRHILSQLFLCIMCFSTLQVEGSRISSLTEDYKKDSKLLLVLKTPKATRVGMEIQGCFFPFLFLPPCLVLMTDCAHAVPCALAGSVLLSPLGGV